MKAEQHWNRVGKHHHHGIAVPLFSLHSHTSCGVGEFTDLIKLIDWCSGCGMDTIQLLPLNDTGRDPSPYSALSAFALNPMYLGLLYLPRLGPETDELKKLQKLTKTKRVCYKKVRALKLKFLKRYVEKHKAELRSDPEYRKFVEENPWLVDYALFKVLRLKHGRDAWQKWPDEERNPTSKTFQRLIDENQEAMHFHQIVQFLCDQQMRDVKEHAERKGVLLMGDLPILISKKSHDVWHHREYFNMDLVAGAPPDLYAAKGQNWDLPLYRWESMEGDNYQWWRDRLKLAGRYFHLYRLDHVVGFFRLWGISPGRPGTKGHYYPDEFQEWLSLGVKHLHMMLEASPLLPIGEDLGIVPQEMKRTMESLGIPGTKFMRWERHYENGGHFIPVQEYPKCSFTTITTHDSPPLALWWATSRYAKEFAKGQGWKWTKKLPRQQRLVLLRMSHESGSLFHVNPLQEYLALFNELSYSSPKKDRINVPGKVSKKNWTYRLRPSLEELLDHAPLSRVVSSLIPNC